MTINPTVTERLVFDDLAYTNTYTQVAGNSNYIDEPIPDASTDLEVTWSCDVSELINFIMVCDQDVLVETNDGTTPDDSFSLVAGVPVFWSVSNGMSHANPFSADVTTNIFVTNASGEAATLQIRATTDPTP